jgi:hypothetical protein
MTILPAIVPEIVAETPVNITEPSADQSTGPLVLNETNKQSTAELSIEETARSDRIFI